MRASALNLAAHCPGAYALAVAHPTSSDAATRGTEIHAHLEQWLRDGDLPAVLADFVVWFNREYPDHGLGERYIEVAMAWETLTGHADLVVVREDSVVVIDWKTGGGIHLPPIERDWQLAAYAVMAAMEFDRDHAVVHRVMVDDLRADTREMDANDLLIAANWIAYTIETVEKNPQRILGHHCQSCYSRAYCPEYSAQAEPMVVALSPGQGMAIQSEQDAARLALALEPVKAALKLSESAIKGWVREHGDLRVNGQTYGPRTHQKETIPNASIAISDLAIQIGDYAALAMSTSKSGINKALEAAGWNSLQRETFLESMRCSGRVTSKDVETWRWRKTK